MPTLCDASRDPQALASRGGRGGEVEDFMSRRAYGEWLNECSSLGLEVAMKRICSSPGSTLYPHLPMKSAFYVTPARTMCHIIILSTPRGQPAAYDALGTPSTPSLLTLPYYSQDSAPYSWWSGSWRVCVRVLGVYLRACVRACLSACLPVSVSSCLRACLLQRRLGGTVAQFEAEGVAGGVCLGCV